MRNLNVAAWLTVSLTCAGLTAPLSAAQTPSKQEWASPLDNLKPGEWYEAPGSKLGSSGVWPPKPTPPGNPNAVMAAWCGGAYDTKRERLVIHGGGHGDYAGNEIYVFDVKTFKWSRPWGPSKEIPSTTPDGEDAYSDGNPCSTHTYDGMIYLPVQDKLLRVGGGRWSGSGCGTPCTWLFDFDALKWEKKASSLSLGVGVFAQYDPVTGHIFGCSDRSMLQEYDPAANTWTARGKDVMDRGEETTSALDPENRLFMGIGNGKLNVYHIKTNTITNRQKSTGGDAVVNARGPGLAYDPVLKKIVGYGGGTALYSLNAATWTWTEHKAAPGNTVTPKIADPRLVSRLFCFSKFQYIPSKNAYIVVTGVGDSVYFCKLTDDKPGAKPK